MQDSKVGAVMVIGGGIGGIQASLDLSNLGFKVYMVEKSPAIGGLMAKLDKTYPTNDCSMCILAPKMVEVGRNPNIELITYSEVEEVKGEAGNFLIKIRKKARFVNEKYCKNCGLCAEKCPIRVKDEFNELLGVRAAIYIPYPQAIPTSYLIDPKVCLFKQKGICRLCEKICEAKAVNFTQQDEFITINVGAIIVTVGAEISDISNLSELGYKYVNVINSLEFERILNAAGPYGGEVLRPSDHLPPSKILFLTCVGSRNRILNKNYCSAFCCMAAIKEAVIAKEHNPRINSYLFFTDIRAVGKGFDEYYRRAQNSGINIIKAKVSGVDEDPISNKLFVNYENTETGEFFEEEFDLIVLSVGFQQSKSSVELCNKLGINVNKYGFCHTESFNSPQTNREGIYAVGTLSGPKDIPETVTEASAAAAMAASLLRSEKFKLSIQKEYPTEINVRLQEPRIGVFLCKCGINIGAFVNINEVLRYVETLPNVVYAEKNLYTCSQDTQDHIKQIITLHRLNRIIIASCTPRTHESLFQNTIREAGLNPYLFELVNIREQCSWVHMTEPLAATEKAKELVGMSVAKSKLFEPVKEKSISIIQIGLVIGGGVAGLTAALELANQGYKVYLIEKEKELGGLARKIFYTFEKDNPQERLKDLIEKVNGHNRIIKQLNTKIEEISGSIGNFKITINEQKVTQEISAGIIIVATGGKEYKPKEFMYGTDDRILTQQELEQKIFENKIKSKKIAMIQCVGSRNLERPYCSKICCSIAIKNALKLKALNPDCEILILHRDIRTVGFTEDYYEEARIHGINFIRFKEENPPELNIINKQLQISIYDNQRNKEILFEPDLLILSAAFVPNPNIDLAQMLKVPLDQNGFFLEAHVKLRPLDFATDGIYVCGAAQWPKFMKDSVVQAKGTAARAGIILSKEIINISGIFAQVNKDACIGCGSCYDLCPYNAIEMKKVKKNLERTSLNVFQANILDSICKGCGACVSACPVQAINLPHFTNPEILEMINSLKKVEENEIQ